MTELEQTILASIQGGTWTTVTNPLNKDFIVSIIKDDVVLTIDYTRERLFVAGSYVKLDIFNEVISYYNAAQETLRTQHEVDLLAKIKLMG